MIPQGTKGRAAHARIAYPHVEIGGLNTASCWVGSTFQRRDGAPARGTAGRS